ncbi:MAG TPA: toll/interleukin-1 receptor domain-containing protein [Allosphingosinicella sp.]|jgi:hypothetical protein
MADVFVTYKREDTERVAKIVKALRADGFDVWWDHGIGGGAQWRKEVAAQLEAARTVVAVWSKQSVQSEWVIEEAEHGKRKGILCPIMIEPVRPPIGFTGLQACDLTNWRGRRYDPKWKHVRESLRALLERRPVPEPPATTRISQLIAFAKRAAAAVAFVAAVAGGLQQFGIYDVSTLISPKATAEKTREWAALRLTKDCARVKAYISADPGGPFAKEAEALLAGHRAVRRSAWVPLEQSLPAFGVSPVSATGSRAAACASARAAALEGARENCGLFESNGARRGFEATLNDRECECQDALGKWQCSVRTVARCVGEQRREIVREICGG